MMIDVRVVLTTRASPTQTTEKDHVQKIPSLNSPEGHEGIRQGLVTTTLLGAQQQVQALESVFVLVSAIPA